MWLSAILVGYTCLVMVQQVSSQRPCITARSAAHDVRVHSASMPASTHSSATDVDADGRSEAPQVEALFLIKFDKKVG